MNESHFKVASKVISLHRIFDSYLECVQILLKENLLCAEVSLHLRYENNGKTIRMKYSCT